MSVDHPVTDPVPLTTGERYEKLAFTFCRAATIILIAQRYALIVAAGAAAALYLMAYMKGKKETRCVLRSPLVAAAFWGVVCLIAVYGQIQPLLNRTYTDRTASVILSGTKDLLYLTR